MSNYRAVVHYCFKKGKEEEGLRFLERELIRQAERFGCHHIELLQKERDHTDIVGIALWHDIEDARRFQAMWEMKERELAHLCTHPPKREFFKIRNTFAERQRRAA
jgi:hypothetical protein